MTWFTIWSQFFLRYFARSVKLLEPVRFNREKKKKTREIKTTWYAICSVYTHLVRLKISHKTSSDQNLKKHWENLGSKLTTKFNDKVSWEVRGLFVFSAGSFVFLLQCYWFVYKKSLTSFVLNKHVHWFIFLHFDPVQIISLLWALHKLCFLSFIHDFSGCVVIVTELVASHFEL